MVQALQMADRQAQEAMDRGRLEGSADSIIMEMEPTVPRAVRLLQKLQAALNYIQNQCYPEALNVLSSIPFSERAGQWYYYSAVANEGVGNSATAIEHIRRAVELEPSNMEYRQFQQHLEYGGTWYTNMGSEYERPYGNYSNFCMSLLCAQALCFCCRPC